MRPTSAASLLAAVPSIARLAIPCRIAAILQGIAKRAIEGTAASSEAAEVGRIARPLAEQAWELARSL